MGFRNSQPGKWVRGILGGSLWKGGPMDFFPLVGHLLIFFFLGFFWIV